MKTTTTMTIGFAAALLLAACGDEPPATQNAATETVTVTGPAEAAATVTVTEEAGAGATVTVTETAEADAPETVTETVTAVAAEEAEPEEEPEVDPEPEANSGEIAFGETWTWDDGTSVTVSEPEPFTPSEYSAGGEGYDEHLLFTVTVENGSGGPLDLGLFTMTMQSGRSEADQVFDYDAGLEGSPYTTLLDGRTVEFEAGFGVEDPDDLVLQLAPTFDHDDAYFVG